MARTKTRTKASARPERKKAAVVPMTSRPAGARPAAKVSEVRSAADTPPAVRHARVRDTLGEPGVHDVLERDLERQSALPGEARLAGRGKYVYCIIRSPEFIGFGPIGIGPDPAEVYSVNYRDLAAVVSESPMGVQDPTRENVLAHQRVNEMVMGEHTVLPMSFGTVFKTHDDIIELLKSAYDAFDDVLTKMSDKLEFGLKVLWDHEQIVRGIETEDEDISRLKSEIASQKGSTYFARMQYGRLVDAALQGRSERYVAEIFSELRDVSVASRSNKPIGDKMIMNAAFLVSRDSENDFDARVKEIGARYEKLTFKYTGPWPPYNFVNIRLKLERA